MELHDAVADLSPRFIRVISHRLCAVHTELDAFGYASGWPVSGRYSFWAWAYCDVENGVSARVLERSGMQYQGILRRGMFHPNKATRPRRPPLLARPLTMAPPAYRRGCALG